MTPTALTIAKGIEVRLRRIDCARDQWRREEKAGFPTLMSEFLAYPIWGDPEARGEATPKEAAYEACPEVVQFRDACLAFLDAKEAELKAQFADL